MDARNHGDSPHSQHMSYELMSEDTVGLLKELGVTKTVLVGHSMGGKTAMVTALRYPAMVDRLVILDVVPNIKATSTGDLQQLVTAMKSLDTSSVTDRRQADDQLKQHIPVSQTAHVHHPYSGTEIFKTAILKSTLVKKGFHVLYYTEHY